MSNATAPGSQQQSSSSSPPPSPSFAPRPQLKLTHPKNYFGLVPAICASPPTEHLISEHLVGLPDAVWRGATALGLVSSPNNSTLTSLGHRVATYLHTTVTSQSQTGTPYLDVLDELKRLQGSSSRFIAAAPQYWEPICTFVLRQNPLVGDIITAVTRRSSSTLATISPSILGTGSHFDSALHHSQAGQYDPTSPDRYRSQITYQLKSVLFHCGILTERGHHTEALVPETDRWLVEPRHLSLTVKEGSHNA